MSRLKSKTQGIWIFSDYKKPRNKVLYIGFITILALFAIISVFPPLWLFLSCFKTPEQILSTDFIFFPAEFDLQVIGTVWRQFNFSRYYLNSMFLVFGAVICSIIFNGLLAYAIAVIKPAGSKLIDTLVISTLLIPAIINISPLYMNIIGTFNAFNTLLGINVWSIPYFSYLPLWLIYGANAYYYVLFKIYFQSIPQALFEAASIDGANRIQMFRFILVPLSMPIIAVVAIFTVNASWSDFLLPSLMTQIRQSEQPIMVRLYNMFSDQMAEVSLQEKLMTIMFSVVPPIILFALFQKRISQSVATSGLKE